MLELLDEACHRLPEETRQARWLLKERDEFLAKMQREGEDILQAARLQAERMVQRTEIVREAQATARRSGRGGPRRGPPAAAGGGGLLRPEAGRLRGGPGPDHQDRRGRPGEAVDDARCPCWTVPTPGIAGIELDDTLGGEDAFFDQDRT